LADVAAWRSWRNERVKKSRLYNVNGSKNAAPQGSEYNAGAEEAVMNHRDKVMALVSSRFDG
jgi:hypothetical protein